MAADYSQIELGCWLIWHRNRGLIEAFEQGQDIHAATAAEVMGIPIEQVDPDSRRLAKTINFGVLYGMGVMDWRATPAFPLRRPASLSNCTGRAIRR